MEIRGIGLHEMQVQLSKGMTYRNAYRVAPHTHEVFPYCDSGT